jgi:hypothetical protein
MKVYCFGIINPIAWPLPFALPIYDVRYTPGKKKIVDLRKEWKKIQVFTRITGG